MSDFRVWCPDYGHEEDDAMHIRDAYDHAAAARNGRSGMNDRTPNTRLPMVGVLL